MEKAKNKQEYFLNAAKDLRAEAERLEARAEQLKAAKTEEGTLPPCIVNTCWVCTPA
jgi:hypothetical protein